MSADAQFRHINAAVKRYLRQGLSVIVEADGADARSARTRRPAPSSQNTVISWIRDDPRHILMQIARDDRTEPSVHRLDIYDNDGLWTPSGWPKVVS